MVRNPDESIPDTELLYRATRPEHTKGTIVLESAFRVGFPEISVDRATYATPEETASRLPNHTSAVQIRVGDVPARLERQPAAADYLYEVEDLPLEENEAHAAIRIRRDGDPYNEQIDISSPNRVKLRQKLAERASVVLAPR